MQEATGLDQLPIDKLRVPAGFMPVAGLSHIVRALALGYPQLVSMAGCGPRRFDDLLLVCETISCFAGGWKIATLSWGISIAAS